MERERWKGERLGEVNLLGERVEEEVEEEEEEEVVNEIGEFFEGREDL